MGETLRQRLEILLLARVLAATVFLAAAAALLLGGVASRALGGPAFIWGGGAFAVTLLSALALRAVDAAGPGASAPGAKRPIGAGEAGPVSGVSPAESSAAPTEARGTTLAWIAWAQLPIEIVLVAGLVTLGGGARGPAVGLLVLPVLNAAAVLPARGPILAASGGAAILALLSVWEIRAGRLGGLSALALVAGGAAVLVAVAVAVGRFARAAAAAEARASRTETEIRAAIAGRDALASTLEAGIVVLDSTGRIRSANPAAQRIFGLSSMEMQSRRLAALLPSVAGEGDPAGASDADAAVVWFCAGAGAVPTRLRLGRVALADAFGRAVGEIVVLNEIAATAPGGVADDGGRTAEPVSPVEWTTGDRVGPIETAAPPPLRAVEVPPLAGETLSLAELTGGDAGPGAAEGLIGATPAMRELWRMIGKAAPTDATVLITGESGTGKELVARALHRHSHRARGPFVALNCGAIPEGLIESELFGHVRGAFTGAVADRPGLFRRAQGGTIFLDEIGELPARLQVRLLRVLQERVVVPVGGGAALAVDVRVIAATNRDLHVGRQGSPAREGRSPSGAATAPVGLRRSHNEFRDDLYYRLAVLALVLPPLRERRDDLPRLVAAFVRSAADRHGRPIGAIERVALDALCRHRFPGNVRELENSLEHAVTLADGGTLRLADLPDAVRATVADPSGEHLIRPARRPLEPVATRLANVPTPSPDAPRIDEPRCAPEPLDDEAFCLDEFLERHERALILAALDRSRGVRTRAAELLGIGYRSLRHRLARLDLG